MTKQRDELIRAVEDFIKSVNEHYPKRDVKKHYHLMVAEVAVQNAIRKERGQ